MKSILDPSFRYTPSFNTDIQKTFARFRDVQRIQAKHAVQSTATSAAKIVPIDIDRKPSPGRR